MTKPKAAPAQATEPEAPVVTVELSEIADPNPETDADAPGVIVSSEPFDPDAGVLAFEDLLDPLEDETPDPIAEDDEVIARGPIRDDGHQVVVTASGRKLVVDPEDDFVLEQTAGPGTSADHDNPAAPQDAE